MDGTKLIVDESAKLFFIHAQKLDAALIQRRGGTARVVPRQIHVHLQREVFFVHFLYWHVFSRCKKTRRSESIWEW